MTIRRRAVKQLGVTQVSYHDFSIGNMMISSRFTASTNRFIDEKALTLLRLGGVPPEVILGLYVDGKPLYRRTLCCWVIARIVLLHLQRHLAQSGSWHSEADT